MSSDRPVSPLATVPEETPGHGLLKGKKVVVIGACTSGHDIAQDHYLHGVGMCRPSALFYSE